MEFQYDLSVLIPVYNAEKTIEETLESILNQKNELNLKLEILLLNDGSTDNSETICQQYAKQYENIKYFPFENSGVSKTRNRGLDLAKGKYILFLDSDDLLAEDTIQGNFKIFEQYYDEANILTYPIYKYRNEQEFEHPRTKLYSETYLCDVEEYPHINQTSMNVIIKNMKEKIYFNESMPFAEDTFFNIDMILSKGKIIVSSIGKYLYRTNSFSTVNRFKSPVVTAQYLINSYIDLISRYEKNGKVSKYIQSVILYELNWRMKWNALFPRHLSEKEYSDWEARYKKVLSYMEEDVVLSNPNIDKYHQYYFLKNNFTNENLKIDFNKENILFTYNNKEILNIEDFFIVFTKFKIIDDKIVASGYIKKPLIALLGNDIHLYLVNLSTKEKVKLDLFKSNYGYYKSVEYTNLFLQFDCDIPLTEGVFDFKVEVKGNMYNTKYYFTKKTIVKSITVRDRRVFYKNYCIDTTKNVIDISSNLLSPKNIKNRVAFYNRVVRTRNIKCYLYKYFQKDNPTKINLYSDRHSRLSEAYQLFKQNLKNKKGEQHYYVYKNATPMNILEKIDPAERKYVIKFGSRQHRRLFLNADNVYTSSTNFVNYCPFSLNQYNVLAENFHYNLIWLKGYMNIGYSPKIYSREITNIDTIIVKNEADKKNLIENYNYNEDQIIISQDQCLANSKESEKRILISFTWRNYLYEPGIRSFEDKKKGRFANSAYFHNLMKLLDSEEMNMLMEKGYKIDLYLHPNFQIYSDFFNLINMKINYLHQLESISQYDVLISDYSSLINAFESMGKRTIKYHIDYDEFKCGNHLYKELLDENGYVSNHEELMKKLHELGSE